LRTAENAEELRRLIQSLPPDYCQVIMLRHYSNLSFPEIGATMGRSPDAVRKLWLRALDELQSRMRHEP
jgi:RNA polymerase sigma factor (sigma-70 family)